MALPTDNELIESLAAFMQALDDLHKIEVDYRGTWARASVAQRDRVRERIREMRKQAEEDAAERAAQALADTRS